MASMAPHGLADLDCNDDSRQPLAMPSSSASAASTASTASKAEGHDGPDGLGCIAGFVPWAAMAPTALNKRVMNCQINIFMGLISRWPTWLLFLISFS